MDLQTLSSEGKIAYLIKPILKVLQEAGGQLERSEIKERIADIIHKYALPEDVPEHTMFVITTDGQENASHRYNSEQVKKMIERQKEKYGWEFLFIGANIDAVETAARYGIDKDRAVNYNADGEGTHILYESVAKAVCNVRASAPLSADWSEEINADYQRRGKKK